MTYTASHHEMAPGNHPGTRKESIFSRLIEWATQEDEKRHLAWVGGSVTSMTAVFFPITMGVILLNGAGFGFIIAAMVSLVLVVVTNLAAMPTRYTIPCFFLGILIDLGVVVGCLLHG